MAINQQRWRTLWHRVGGQSDGLANADVHFDALHAQYSEPQRAYHNLDHISDCLRQFDAVMEQAKNADEVELAIWLHDVIYDTHAADNEAQSAAWAADVMTQDGINKAQIDRVCNLILATAHSTLPTEADAQLLVDIDLSILGRREAEFDEYESKIRQEYAWVPEAAFKQGRIAVLESFLARNAIYQTALFRQRYEAAAQRNLQRSIAQLR